MHSGHDHEPDYNFIMNPAAPPKKGLFGGMRGGGIKKQRLLFLVAGSTVLLIVLVMLFSLLFGGGSDNTERLVGIYVKQAEIARIAAIGEQDATSADTRNYASTVSLSMISAQNDLEKILDKHGREVKAKELQAGKNKETDQSLTEAQQANNFDEVFNETIKNSLRSYQRDLAEAYKNAASKSERAALQPLYISAGILTGEKSED